MNSEFQMKYSVLVIGCGEHSMENLLPSLAGMERVEVTALCDPDEHSILAASKWFPGARKTLPLEITSDFLSKFDAVVVAATPQVHVDIARKSIAARVPVFVEKPPAVLTVDLIELAESAERNGVITCVGHNLRHSDAATHFRNAIVSATFGRPVAMEMRYLASKPRGVRWGLESSLKSFLLSHANHAIDLMIHQMGDIRQVVAARASPDVDGGVAISAQFVFKTGAIGNLLATSYAPHFTVAATVVSERGQMATMNGLSDVTLQGHHELGKRWSSSWEPRTLETGFRFAGYQTELERFFLAIQNATPDAIHPSFRDEVAVYEAMDLIERSIRDNS
jgi:predicted dehydrogenase